MAITLDLPPDVEARAAARAEARGLTLGVPDVVVAITNVGHLVRFVPARLWQDV